MSYSYTFDLLFKYRETAIFLNQILQKYNIDTIVDLPCGGGYLLSELSSLGVFNLYGVDFNTDQLKSAKSKCPQALLYNYDIFNMNFKNVISSSKCNTIIYIGNSFVNMFPEEQSLKMIRNIVESGICEFLLIEAQNWPLFSKSYPVGYLSKKRLNNFTSFESTTLELSDTSKSVFFRFFRGKELIYSGNKWFYNFNIERCLSFKEVTLKSKCRSDYRGSELHDSFLLEIK